MYLVNFKNAKRFYKLFSRKREVKQFKNIKELYKYPYLILSNLFDRDIFSSEYCINESLFHIGYKNFFIDKDLFSTFTRNNKLTIYIGRLFDHNNNERIKLLPKLISFYVIKNIFIHFLKCLLSLLDVFLILIYSVFYISIIKPFITKKDIKDHINEIYTFTYFKSKGIQSIIYFYPNFNHKDIKLGFVSNFHEYKFLIKGLIDSSFHRNIINALWITNILTIFKSARSLFCLYLWDLSLLKDFSYGKLISYFQSLKFINRKFYYLISFYSIPELINFNPNLIYVWNENQLHSKVISYGIGNFLKLNKKLNIKCINYIGYPFFYNFYPHWLPSLFELNANIWGSNNFMFINEHSLEEMRFSMEILKYNNCIFEIAGRKLNRHMNGTFDNNFKASEKKFITLFSHANVNDILIMVKYLNNNCKSLINSKPNIFVRLHPTISKKIVIRDLIRLNVYDINKFKFINKDNESIEESIISSEYCIFSESNIINKAIMLDAKIIVCRSSFIYDNPIYMSLNRKNYL